MQEILDIVYNYSKNKKLLDNIAVTKIVNILLCLYQLDDSQTVDVRNKSHFMHMFNNTLAYHQRNKITIYLNKIYAYISRKDQFVSFKDDLSFYLRYNLFIVNTLFHEVYHAIEERKIKERLTDIETKLLTLEKEYIIDIELSRFDDGYSPKPDFEYKKELKNYKSNYDISFFERMANNHAYEQSVHLIEPIRSEVSELFDYQEEQLYRVKSKAYKSVSDNPTLRFFTNIHKRNKFEEIDFSTLSTEERFNLGLDLEEQEFETLKLQHKKRRN